LQLLPIKKRRVTTLSNLLKNKRMKGLILIAVLISSLYFDTRQIQISDFSLPNTTGEIVSLSDYKNAKGFIIIFTCNHCPFAQLYPERLNALNKKFEAQGVPLIAINPMDTLVYADENLEQMKEVSKKHQFNFPYLLDASQKVARNFNAKRTPQAYVIWKEQDKWVIKYSGAIDDNGAEPSKVENPFLENAVKKLISGEIVDIEETASIGCKINYRK